MDAWVAAHIAADSQGPSTRREILEYWAAVGFVFLVMFALVFPVAMFLKWVG